ncbi:MAG: hypothetical protein FD167_3177 [bacterium]|nr:MAG: hypothetical protein FD167_3177 [bacterium]
MSKTTEKNTTTKTNKTTSKKPQTKDASTANVAQPKSFSFIKTVQAPVELFKDVTTKSIYFSLGLGALLLDSRQNLQTIQDFKLDSLRNTLNGDLRKNIDTFISNTINKGEKFEKDTAQSLKDFEQSQRNRVKEFFTAPKPQIKTENTIEEKIEEVIANLDLPTRDELHQLNRRLAELSRQLSPNQRNNVSRKTKTTKADTAVNNTEVLTEGQTTESANA